MRISYAAIALAAIAGQVRSAHAGTLETVPAPTQYHGAPAAARLGDGRILLTGAATSGFGASSSAQIFDPAKKEWTTVAPMKRHHTAHAAITLPSGKVLVVGGQSDTTPTPEIYDPATDTWTDSGDPATTATSAALLTDGRVAVVSSAFGSLTLRFFDPPASSWAAGPSVARIHSEHFIASLDGGGFFLVSLNGAERYAPGSGWSAAAAPPEPRRTTGATALADGRVLIVGGGTDSKSGKPLLYEPSTDSFRELDGLRRGGRATVTPVLGGRYLFAGGTPIDAKTVLDLEVFNPATLGVTHLMTSVAFTEVVVAPLADGRALLLDTRFGSAYIVDPPRGCDNASECESGFCVDGFCCDTACNGRCEACDVAPSLGTCTGVSGVPHGSREECSPPWTPACRALTCDAARSRTDCVAPVFAPPCDCGSDAECSSGHCVDGVCCNTACDGQCEACDLPGSRGVCVPVTGEPRGIRKGCPAAGRGICSVRGCDGKETRACAYSHGPETVCDTICGGRVVRHCNGSGLCGLPTELQCPDTGCSVPSTEPSAPPRFFDAVLVVALGALIERARRARR